MDRRGTQRPPFLLVPGLVAVLFLALPLAALLLQTPWGSLVGIAGSPTALAALRLSLLTSVAATLVAGPLKPGQVIKYRKAAMQQVITGWRPATTQNVAVLYNVGDPSYARKLDYALTLIHNGKTAACK